MQGKPEDTSVVMMGGSGQAPPIPVWASTLQGGTRAGKEDCVNATWRFSPSANLVGTREALFEDPQKSQEG